MGWGGYEGETITMFVKRETRNAPLDSNWPFRNDFRLNESIPSWATGENQWLKFISTLYTVGNH